MKTIITIFFLAFVFCTGIPVKIHAQATNKKDSLALVDLYNSTHGENWRRNDNWLVGPVRKWHGIKVSDTRVTEILLDGNGLIGSIPSALGNLSNLQTLDLSGNVLQGNIPPQLGNLSNLQTLALKYNQLSGNIPPEIGNLSNLDRLVLGTNNLSGSIPAGLGNLSKLQTLDLSYNQLSGNIPPELGKL